MHRAALLVICCACLGAQPAAIEGVVVNQANGRPMPGVHVRLLSAAASADMQPYGAMTDLAGHFSIARLPAGIYIADAIQRGFFRMPPKGGGPLQRVSLKAGQQLTGFKIEMAQGATISGRVLDENGDPMQAGVHAEAESERAMYYGGRWGSGDERGEFHLSLPPGKYYIVAEAGGGVGEQEIRTDGTVGVVYGRTYYPGSAAKGKAVPVEAMAGAELTGVDIHLVRQARGGSIGGVVTGTAEAGGTMVALQRGDDSGHMGFAGNAGADQDGHFLFSNLQPGTYRLFARHRSDKNWIYSQPIEVRLEGGDVTNANLVLAPGGELTGKLEMAGSPGTEKLSVALEPTQPGYSFGDASAEVDQSGAFHIANIAPGTYRVKVTPIPENAYLKSVRLDGIELPGGELDLWRAAQGSSLKIVVSRNGGQIQGKLLDKGGEPVGAMPAMVILVTDPQEIDLERSLKMVEDGTYLFQGLRPGKYRLLAFDEWGPEFLEMVKKVAASAEEIEIMEGDRKVKDLKLLVKEDSDAKPSQ
ncbi:MAG: carboxypeptidase regulatory-like domain-containing protein [Bryobacteraceae bacterium]